MKKLGILTCLDACQVCTGALCFEAFNGRERYFSQYAGQEVMLAAFLHCNGCQGHPETVDPRSDPGIMEKLDRLQTIGVEVVHTGVCTICNRDTGEICPVILTMEDMIRQRGIEVFHGTH